MTAAESLPSRWAGVEDRLPEAFDDLRGPSEGTVALPLHLAWSGRREFDLANEQHGLQMYQIVLCEGRRTDVERYLHRDALQELWPKLRRLVGRQLREAWEMRFTDLAT